MRRRRFHGIFAASVFVACAIPMGLSQTSQNSAMVKVDLSSSSRTALEAAIRKTIEDEDSAYARLDGSAALSYTSDDEGMFYDRDSGRLGSQAFKQTLANAFGLAKSDPRKYEYEITKLYVLPLAPDITLANYVLIIKITLDGKTEMNRQANTDVFVLRDGRWLRRASHGEMLPKDIDPIVPGLPTDWKRSTNSTATSYLATVDTAVHHSGNASASLRFSCGSEAEPWTGLSQGLDASAYRGKRVRLTGWIKTADAGEALLWVRADAERRMVAFDKLQGRGARGTGDWKRYEVVIDIPESALILVYGPSLSGKGQAWFDDLTLEVVGKEVPVTAKPIDAGKFDEYSKDVDRSSRTVPVNLGFENGVVK